MIWFRAALVALLLFELVLLAIRLPLTPSKVELLCFSGLLILVIAAGFVPDSTAALGLASLLILWTLGMYARYLNAERRAWVWHGGVGVALSIFLFVRLIDVAETLPFYLLYAFLFVVLALYPLVLFWGICGANPHPLLYLYLTSVAMQLAALLYDYLSYGSGLPVLRLRVFSGLLYAGICGLLLSQEAYLQGRGWQGLHIRLGEQQRRLREAHTRLIQTENTVMLQDRLIITGILTAGVQEYPVPHPDQRCLRRACRAGGSRSAGPEAHHPAGQGGSKSRNRASRSAAEARQGGSRQGRSQNRSRFAAADDAKRLQAGGNPAWHRYPRYNGSDFPAGRTGAGSREPGTKRHGQCKISGGRFGEKGYDSCPSRRGPGNDRGHRLRRRRTAGASEPDLRAGGFWNAIHRPGPVSGQGSGRAQ